MYDAEIVTGVFAVTADVVILNEGETVCPAATVTVPGTVAAALLLPSVTTAPLAGAGPFKVTVAAMGLPPTTAFGVKVTAETSSGVSVKVELTVDP